MFDSLSDKLQGVFRNLRGHGSLTETDVDAALRDIRLALLEADVHFKVVKQFLECVRARATGQDVLKSLTPAQAVIRVVRDEMVELLGGAEAKRLETSARLPSVVLMTGLQGSGKTTTTAKLGRWFIECDRDTNSREAAIELIRSGEVDPVKVLEICEDEGTCRDVTADIIAQATMRTFNRPDAADAQAAAWDRARDYRKHSQAAE